MTLGQVVDYAMTWNEANNIEADENIKSKIRKRKATQADWDAFLG